MQHAIDMFRSKAPVLRRPDARDGAAIWELVQACKPLDENSVYCNLVQCDHFRDTCVVAERDGRVVGWVSGYILPNDPQTLFVWQVAVHSSARGLGLGSLMLASLMERDTCKDITRMQTTITADNEASWSLFRRFSRRRGGALSSQAHFTRDTHFRGLQATEHMVTITFRDRMEAAA